MNRLQRAGQRLGLLLCSATFLATNYMPQAIAAPVQSVVVKKIASRELVARRAAAQRPERLALPASTVSRLRELLARPEVAEARIGVSIRALGRAVGPGAFPSSPYPDHTQPVLFEADSKKRFLPASNMKLYTAALALKTLGANAVFNTSVLASGSPQDGAIHGPLILQGGGDPSLDLPDLEELAKQVRARGITRVEGVESVGDAFGGENINNRYPDGWTLDDALWDYGAEVSALALHRNQIDVTITGGARTGDSVTVTVDPALATLKQNASMKGIAPMPLGSPPTVGIECNVKTGERILSGLSEDDLIHVDRAIASSQENTITLSGAVAPGQSISFNLATPDHEKWAASIFRRALGRAGVQVLPGGKNAAGGLPPQPVAVHQSAPLQKLLADFLKPSDNLYGEMLLRASATHVYGEGKGTAALGHELLRKYLQSEGIDTVMLRFSDGSGLSRYNLVTPDVMTRLLAAIEHLPGSQSIWNALPIAGVDGTLKKRMMGSRAQGNVRAKTGTFSIVSCLSGYVTTRDGNRLAVSILTNFTPKGDDARRLQNDIFTLLADTNLNTNAIQMPSLKWGEFGIMERLILKILVQRSQVDTIKAISKEKA